MAEKCQNGKGGLPNSVLEECKASFAMFDRDGSGTITFDEFVHVMRLLGNNPTDSDCREMMESLDENKNGTIDFEEFKKILEMHWKDPVNEEEEMLHAFKVFDRNNDGYVVAEEIRYVMKNLGHSLTEKEVRDIINQGDGNGDGKLDYQEFVKVMQGKL